MEGEGHVTTLPLLFNATKAALFENTSTTFVKTTAENPVNPIFGAKNVATIIIMAKTLLSEKNI